jgi:hypothetical protein
VETIAAVFVDRLSAERAVQGLRSLGVPEAQISYISPGSPSPDLTQAIPTMEAEQPGVGRALGAVVGGAAGATAGVQLATAAVGASLVLPFIGPVIATGAIAGALLGLGAGAAIGDAVEDAGTVGLPKDELFVYEDALRRGRTVVIASVEAGIADAARAAMQATGAETLDAARQDWWIGLREAEAARYAARGDFARDEATYRRGFEAALDPDMRGTTYETSRELLARRFPDVYAEQAFRLGWEGGQAYHQALMERFASAGL